jgi:hypothetical protein
MTHTLFLTTAGGDAPNDDGIVSGSDHVTMFPDSARGREGTGRQFRIRLRRKCESFECVSMPCGIHSVFGPPAPCFNEHFSCVSSGHESPRQIDYGGQVIREMIEDR